MQTTTPNSPATPTPNSTALGKRPLAPNTSGSQPLTVKTPRLDTNTLLATLKETAAALTKIGGEALSEEQMHDATRACMLIFHMKADHDAERKRRSERPFDEVMMLKTAEVTADGAPIFRSMELAPEMREVIVAFLSPKEMGRVVCVSRAWQAAVRAACATRLRALQLEWPCERRGILSTLQPLTTEQLARLEEQTVQAPMLLKRLSDVDFEQLSGFERCVIKRHIDLIEPHLRSFTRPSWRLLHSCIRSAEWLVAHTDLIIECATSGQKAAYIATCLFDRLPSPIIEARIGDILPALASTHVSIRVTLLEVLQKMPRTTLAHIPGLRGHLAPLLGSQERGTCIPGGRLCARAEGEIAREVDRLLA